MFDADPFFLYLIIYFLIGVVITMSVFVYGIYKEFREFMDALDQEDGADSETPVVIRIPIDSLDALETYKSAIDSTGELCNCPVCVAKRIKDAASDDGDDNDNGDSGKGTLQ